MWAADAPWWRLLVFPKLDLTDLLKMRLLSRAWRDAMARSDVWSRRGLMPSLRPDETGRGWAGVELAMRRRFDGQTILIL